MRDLSGATILTYRSFASVIGIVASLAATIVVLSGIAAALFLVAEQHGTSAAMAVALSLVFAFLILMLVPRITVTLFHENDPMLTISQRSWSSFPSATYTVVTPDGQLVATLSRTFLAQLLRSRWRIADAQGQVVGYAAEESLRRAIGRKLLGKFSRRFESDVRIEAGGKRAGAVIRRQHPKGEVDVLDCTSDIDRRIAVALAVLVLGSEP